MTKVQLLEREVRKLDPNGLKAFREWFSKHDAEAWDRQIARDARSGKLKNISENAVKAHKAGRSREL